MTIVVAVTAVGSKKESRAVAIAAGKFGAFDARMLLRRFYFEKIFLHHPLPNQSHIAC